MWQEIIPDEHAEEHEVIHYSLDIIPARQIRQLWCMRVFVVSIITVAVKKILMWLWMVVLLLVVLVVGKRLLVRTSSHDTLVSVVQC